MFKAIQKAFLKKTAFLEKLKKDEEGASLIEYTVLIGLITIAVIALISAVGQTIVSKWTTLNNTFT